MARKIKFALEMANGVKVRSDLEALRKNFDLDSVAGYFLSGKLMEWLEDRYYDDEADKLRALDKDAPNLHQQLCVILGVEYRSEDDPDVDFVERVNEKNAILRQKTSIEDIIAHAAETALTQEDLADLLDMGTPVIYLCGENFNVPIRVGGKKYVGILGTPQVTIKANSQTDLDAKGISFENVELPWANIGNSENVTPTMEQAFIVSRSNWPVPFEKLHKVVMSSFAKEFAYLKENAKEKYNHDKDCVWTVVGSQQDVELDETQKEIAVSVVCGGEYDIGDLVYIRVNEDLSAGWAFTKDSFCANHDDGAMIIPYKFIKVEKRKGENDDEKDALPHDTSLPPARMEGARNGELPQRYMESRDNAEFCAYQ